MALLSKKYENSLLGLLLVVLAIFIIGLIGNLSIQGYPIITGWDTQTSLSSVTVQSYVALSKSANFTDGIRFGSLDPGTNNNNATANYNSSSNTLFDIEITDSNVNIDFCISADDLNTSGGDVIELGNYTWNDSSVNNITFPDYSVKSAMTATGSGATGSTNLSNGTTNYYRFWLTIPNSQAPGTYNNTISMEGFQTGGSCSI